MKLLGLAVSIALAAAPAVTHAAPVSVSMSFDRFTMGGFYSASHADAVGLWVNGIAINLCPEGPTCDNAMANPTSITTPLAGGSSLTFGYDPAGAISDPRMNVLSFVGNTEEVSGPGDPFVLGTLTFTNGMFFPLAFIDFTLTTHSSAPGLNNQSFRGRFRLDTNATDGTDPRAEADYYTVQDTGGNTLIGLGSVRVYDYAVCPSGHPQAPDCNTGSVQLIGSIGSLHLEAFTNAMGGAFLNSSTGPVLDPGTSAPEPATWLLAGVGLLGIGAARRARL